MRNAERGKLDYVTQFASLSPVSWFLSPLFPPIPIICHWLDGASHRIEGGSNFADGPIQVIHLQAILGPSPTSRPHLVRCRPASLGSRGLHPSHQPRNLVCTWFITLKRRQGRNERRYPRADTMGHNPLNRPVLLFVVLLCRFGWCSGRSRPRWSVPDHGHRLRKRTSGEGFNGMLVPKSSAQDFTRRLITADQCE
jgi:hypothetical protein